VLAVAISQRAHIIVRNAPSPSSTANTSKDGVNVICPLHSEFAQRVKARLLSDSSEPAKEHHTAIPSTLHERWSLRRRDFLFSQRSSTSTPALASAMTTSGEEDACVDKALQRTITHGLDLVVRALDLYGCGPAVASSVTSTSLVI
jgi:hypothetical protein